MAPTITVEIDGNSAKLQQELSKSAGSVMDFGRQLKGLAAAVGLTFGAAQVLAFGNSLLKDAEYASTLSQELGISLDKLLALKRLGEETGIPFEKTAQLLQKAADTQAKLIQQGAGGDLAKKLGAVGIDVFAFSAMDAADALEELVKKAKDADTGVAVLNETLGRGAAVASKELFSGATESLAKLAEQAGLTKEAYERLTEAQDKIDRTVASARAGATTAVGRTIDVYERVKLATGDSTWGKIGAGLATAGVVVASWMDKLTGLNVAPSWLAEFPKLRGGWKGYSGTWDEGPGDTPLGKAESRKEYDAYHKRIAEESAKSIKDAAEAREKAEKIYRDSGDRYVAIQANRQQAIRNLTVDVTAPNSLQRMGGLLGGRGGYEFSVAERMAKLAEIQTDYNRQIADNTRETNQKLAEG